MTEQQLAAIEARANAATAGPWRADVGFSTIPDGPPEGVAVWCQTPGSEGDAVVADLGDYTDGPANGAFIANAREDVPALVAEVRRLRADVAERRLQAETLAAKGLNPKRLDSAGRDLPFATGPTSCASARRRKHFGTDEPVWAHLTSAIRAGAKQSDKD